MPNPYFKFKQFVIHHDRCAMKVCTDACLFGAWVAAFFHPKSHQINKILDIGTGSGLLTLMLAQKLNASIDAMEIDENACLQAKDNINASAWKDRINPIHADVKHFNFIHQYDLIISNPPFYENDLRSEKQTANIARHDETLTLEALLFVASSRLLPGGSFVILTPYHRLGYCIHTAASFNLFPHTIILVKQTTDHSYFRSIIIFNDQPVLNINKNEFCIKEGEHYTNEFKALLKDYYLHL